MEEDIIQLPSCGDPDDEIHEDEDEADMLGVEVGEVGIQDGVILEQSMEGDTEIEEGQLILKTAEITGKLIETTETGISGFVALRCENDGQVEEDQLVSDGNGAVVEEIATEIEREDVAMPPENGCVIEREKIGSISGVKRMRVTSDEQQPSVHVKYSCLSRQSKQKLEELLREWSEWHVQKSSGNIDENGGSETGEGTYFPALDIGTERTSAVCFWMENEIRKPEGEDFMPVEDSSVPLYDREFALGSISADGLSNLEGGPELLDAARCFNCGSYSHSLRECPKPRDNAAVNNSRKQLKSKRNQTAGMHNPTRYYQDSPGGKYKGLRPGVLDTETRRLLGLGGLFRQDGSVVCLAYSRDNLYLLYNQWRPEPVYTVSHSRNPFMFIINVCLFRQDGSVVCLAYSRDNLYLLYNQWRPEPVYTVSHSRNPFMFIINVKEFDPPPWLNRMREIGYPPGYLEPEDKDVPSGITIYAVEEIKEDKEEGEILEAELVETPQKMSVKFPGINEPIPNDADERVWAARPSNSDRHRNGGSFHSNYSSESYSRGRHREPNNQDFKDNDPFDFDRAPPRYTPRYGDRDFCPPSHSSRKSVPAPRSPTSGRSTGDRGRNDPPDSEDPLAHRLYSSYSYNSSRRFSDHNNDSDGSRDDHGGYSSRGSNREDRYHQRSGR